MIKEPEAITISNNLEIWWDRPITLSWKIPHNRPEHRTYMGQENIFMHGQWCKRTTWSKYYQQEPGQKKWLSSVGRRIATLYPYFKYQIVPVVIGAFGIVTTLDHSWKKICRHWDSVNRRVDRLSVRSIQKRALVGSMKICKIVLKMWTLKSLTFNRYG